MPEITDIQVIPAQLTASLIALVHGPYADPCTIAAADLAAETIRYLNYAVPRGGITEPATAAAVIANLAAALYRMPQALTAISEWLQAESAAGRIADDHRRSPAQLTARIRAAISQATENAGELSSILTAAHNLTATLHATGPAALGTPPAPAEAAR